MDSIRIALTQIKDWLDWLPNPVVAVLIVALAVAIAYSLHRSVRKLLRHLLAVRYPYVLSVFTQMRGVTRLALLILAMIIAIPVAPFDPDTAGWLARLLLIAVIGLVGWTAITALNIAADLYLRQFRIDTDDNLLARKHLTQVRVLMRAADVLVVIITFGAALMTFEPVRQYGVSLFASAGVAGIIAGLAARPVLSNLFAGVQLAMTQPIRIDDAVFVENEWGTIEEINATYVVVRLWDWRRMIVPLTYFIEKPFQNWTRENSALIGSAFIYVDYRAPVAAIREKIHRHRQAIEELGRPRGVAAGYRRQGAHHRAARADERHLCRQCFRPALRGAREAGRFPAKGMPASAAAPAQRGRHGRRGRQLPWRSRRWPLQGKNAEKRGKQGRRETLNGTANAAPLEHAPSLDPAAVAFA